MGIESEKLVYDYLSRVGDLAQQQGLSSGDRMRLVSGLRADIDHRRATGGTDSTAGVKRILAKLGSPADVVAAAGGRAPDPGAGTGTGTGASTGTPSGTSFGTSTPDPAVPEPPRGAAGAARAARDKLAGLAERTGLTGGKVPSPREGNGAGTDDSTSLIKHTPVTPDKPGIPAPRPAAASPPHLAGEDELGPRESDPDWWHVEPGPFAQPEQHDAQYGAVEGFVGGIEIPELLGGTSAEQERRERRERFEKDAAERAAAEEEAEAEADADSDGVPARRRGLLRRALFGRGKAAAADDGGGAAAGAGWLAGLGPLLLVSIALLVAGAVLGNILLLGFGWVLAYTTGRHSRAEAKWAVLGMPGLVAAGGMVWLWGRGNGRWGDPIPKDGMKDALADTWPVVVRAAAVATVLFLVWRARRRG
ncbi:hypothetical protein HUT19_23400 [Streptomyces sp. NA02950]|uniref:hypothetical protein n=1 Tax=Streptomyces sp. NA02950 TaxID=2742137 RepID=UPI00158FCCC8|nr:hypothetical protein [Streptomyces sp. NA02950]QKV94337.1 hypothetical protein HUT19_23400 [Streptomyces sp. NA02950]